MSGDWEMIYGRLRPAHDAPLFCGPVAAQPFKWTLSNEAKRDIDVIEGRRKAETDQPPMPWMRWSEGDLSKATWRMPMDAGTFVRWLDFIRARLREQGDLR